MKYIVTDKHPELKKGLIFEQSILKEEKVSISFARVFMNKEELKQALIFGYIKEVEGLEFTESDMIDFANSLRGYSLDHSEAVCQINDYLKQRSK